MAEKGQLGRGVPGSPHPPKIMTKPLPTILDEIEEAQRLTEAGLAELRELIARTEKAAAVAEEAAAEAREAGLKAGEEAHRAAVEAREAGLKAAGEAREAAEEAVASLRKELAGVRVVAERAFQLVVLVGKAVMQASDVTQRTLETEFEFKSKK